MKAFRIIARGIFLSAVLLNLHAQSTNTNTTVIGQWDFNQRDLRPTVGAALLPFGDIMATTTFETNLINGRRAQVMRFPAATDTQGFVLTHTAPANGGGTNLNDYTLIMDIMWPGESDGAWRTIFNTDTNNVDDGEIFINPDNEIGIFNNYALRMNSETWYRLTLVYNLSSNTLTRFLNPNPDPGNTNGVPMVLDEGGIDSRFSLGRALLLFTDNDGETAPGYVNSIQLRSGAMTAEEVGALGGPSSAGIGGGPDELDDLFIETIQRSGNNLIITVTGGGNIQLLKKVTLNDATWQPTGSPSSTGSFTIPIVANQNTSFFIAQRL